MGFRRLALKTALKYNLEPYFLHWNDGARESFLKIILAVLITHGFAGRNYMNFINTSCPVVFFLPISCF